MQKINQWKKIVGLTLSLIIGFQVFGLDQLIIPSIPTTQAAFYNTGFINLLDGSKSMASEATTIDNLFPLAVSGGNIRTYDSNYSGYNRSNDARAVSSLTGPITLNINLPAGQYDLDLAARYGSQNGPESNENLIIRAGNTSFNIPDQGDNAIFDMYHFSGFNLSSAVTSLQIVGSGEGEIDFGGFRIVGQSSTVNTRPVLSSCSVTTTPTVARAGQATTFTVTANGGSAPFTYAFDFGNDGAYDTVSATNSAQFTYATAGQYTVGIRVTDTAGGLVQCINTITVDQATTSTPTATATPSTSNTPTSTPTATSSSTPTTTPTATSTPTNHAPVCTSISASNMAPQEGVVVTFQAQARDPDTGDTLSYSYNFGDGSVRPSNRQVQAAHDYITPGVYTVTAQVSDSAGLTTNCPALPITVSRFTSMTTPTATATPTATSRPTSTATATSSPTATATATSTPTTSTSPTNTATPTNTSTPSSVPTNTPNLAPSCTITTDNTSPYTGVITTFTIQASDPEGQALTYAVDFGEGNGYVSTGPVSSRSYTTAGNRTIRARVSDGVNLSNCNDINLTVRSNNHAPSCTVSSNLSNPTTNDTLTFTVSATDPDNDALVYSFIFGDGNNQDTTSSTTTHRYTVAGTYPVQVSVRDPGGLIGNCTTSGSTSTTLSVVVTTPSTPAQTNHAPICTFSLNALNATTSTDIAFNVVASDPDNDPLTYTYNFGDGNNTTLNTNTTTHHYTTAGSFVATVSVRDSRGLSTNCSNTNAGTTPAPGTTLPTAITIIVTQPGTPAPTNHAPVCSFVVSSVSSTTANDITFTTTATDPDNDPLTYTYNFGDGTAVSLNTNTTTHRYTSNGNFVALVSVQDNHGLSTTCTNTNTGITVPTTNPSNPTVTTITITITPAGPTNQAPLCQNLNITPGTTLTANTDMTVTITGRDPENSALSYTVRFNDGTADVTTTNNVVHHIYTTAGTYVLRTSISDGSLSTNCAEVTFTINAATPTSTPPTTTPPSNRAPVCTAISIPASAVAGSPVTVTINATDPENQALTYIVNFGDSTNQTSGISPLFHTYAQAGTYTITAQVRDSGNVTVNCNSVALTVSPVPNNAPRCLSTSITPNPVTANTPVTFTVSGSDPDNDPLSYTYFFGDGQSTTSGTGSVTHAFQNNGVYISQIQINDGRGGITNCANSQITVQAPNTSGAVCRALRLVTVNPVATVPFTVEFVPEHPENGPFWGGINFNNGYTSQGFNLMQREGFYSVPGTYRINSSLQDRFGNRTDCPDLFVTIH